MRTNLQIIFLLFCIASNCIAQKRVDSLQLELKLKHSGLEKAKIHLQLGNAFLTIDPENSKKHAKVGLKITESNKDKKLLTGLWGVIGSAHFYLSEWNDCLKAYKKSLEFALIYNEKSDQARAYGNIGLALMHLNKYLEAQNYFLKSLEISESLEDIKGQVSGLGNLCGLYGQMNNYEKEFYYAEKAYILAKKTKEPSRIANALNNLASAYNDNGDSIKTIFCLKEAIAQLKSVNNNWALSTFYANLGMLQIQFKSIKEGELNLLEALKLKKEIKDLSGEGAVHVKLANLYSELKQPLKALEYFKNAEKIFISTEEPDNLCETYKGLADAFKKTGNFNEAYFYLSKYDVLRDTLLSESQALAAEEMATKYETTKKEKEIKLQKQNVKIKNQLLTVKQAELESEKYFKNSVAIGLCLALILAIVIARSLFINKRKNKLITAQKQHIEEKSKEITDSINYAQRIQQAILPSQEVLTEKIPDNFIFYQPKDVVSGDFYQLYQLKNELIIVTADCTGHGVPGAFMSMIGNEQLGKIIIEKEINQPAAILDSLHNGIRTALKQDRSEGETRDGMDVALLKFNYSTLDLEYSGANRPLWIINDDGFVEIKANKQPIGGIETAARTPFTNHKLKIKKGSYLYTFTDGFSDQFGGEKGKKYMLKKLERLLISLQNKTMKEQMKTIVDEFNNWKGNREQIDDVLIIGLRV